MMADMFQVYPPQAKAMIVQRTALGRVGQPRDVADVVAFLACEDSRWLTGQTIYADGGIR
jgi:3-oxoacyl-[acyl-carrier protein] reductase